MQEQVILTAPTCTCCATPVALVPRPDLPDDLAVCPTTGTLYRPDSPSWTRAELPDLRDGSRALSSVRIDLSRAGYA